MSVACSFISTAANCVTSYRMPPHRNRISIAIAIASQIAKCTISKTDGQQPKSFTFDAVYGMDSNSQQIYEEMAFPVVEGVSVACQR
jgi:hypothetical protein